ncbi:glucose 1-dehydrogenase [Aneurinibacillus sp. Ricciae_BoGa-3]|uniref:SDR family NAD(P)-dependent oxidoreductase n=1 Tax=Aneurinibacillus sp. Ricciae_BoGa-3 TaxID=3022697 RepID=UPI0023405932|nr:glucose 1-dehydrogenase [Aneurinibacillus sp. Ricciae_BoGa-3]WCK56248.1 glucose 1-dehydrogenase [Aneurinibacillus sp. Ricciae_BoGa-3]
MNINGYLDMTDKIVIITGASKGLGKGMADMFAEARAKVYLISRSEELLQANVKSIKARGGRADYVAGDLNLNSFIHESVLQIRRKENRIDVLVNNAGIVVPKKALEITEEDWENTIDTNLKSVFFSSQAVATVMKDQGGGKIINVASVMGAVADVSISPYCASKGGVIQLSKAFALEWARYNIQVNAVAPGYVKTEMNSEAFKSEFYQNYILNKIPQKRLGSIDDIAGTAIFLASPLANYITGQTIFVDGGWTAQ